MAAPNRTKDTRTIVPGVWSDALRTYSNLPSGRLLVTGLTQAEAAAVQGDTFRSWQVVTVGANGKSYFFAQTPASGVTVGITVRTVTPTNSGVWFRVYDDPTGVVTGSQWAAYNENGNSPNAAQLKFYNVTSFTTEGTLTDIDYIPATSSSKRIAGRPGEGTAFKILEQGADFLIEIENLTNQGNETLIYYKWIEAPAEITG